MEIMTVVGLLVTLVVVGAAVVFVVRIFGSMSKGNAERERLLREGIQASARVLNVQMGGMTMTVGVHRHLQLHLQVEVQMPGRPPYPAQLTTMVSELQIPQLQPGAMLTVRVDRMNPGLLALEGVGIAQGGMMQGAPPPPYGAPPQAAYGAAPGFAAPAYGAMGMAPGMVPIGGPPKIPAGAKVGLWIGIGGAVVGVLVAIIVVAVNVLGVGLGSAGEGSGVCAQTVRCCEAAASGNASSANCKNYGKLGVPTSACEQSLESFRRMAAVKGRSCD